MEADGTHRHRSVFRKFQIPEARAQRLCQRCIITRVQGDGHRPRIALIKGFQGPFYEGRKEIFPGCKGAAEHRFHQMERQASEGVELLGQGLLRRSQGLGDPIKPL